MACWPSSYWDPLCGIIGEASNIYAQSCPPAPLPNGFTPIWQTVTTTDATLIPVANISFSASVNGMLLLRVYADAIRTGGSSGSLGDGAGFVYTVRASVIAGVVTVKLAQADYVSREQSSWAVTFVPATAAISVQVNGATGNTVDWDVTTLWKLVT